MGFFYIGTRKPNPPGCGGEILTSDGQFSNPPYNDDRNFSDCRWDIIKPSTMRVQLFFFREFYKTL